MALVTLRQLLDHAAENDYGLPAFNINNMEQGLAIMEAAKETDSPVILQASRGARAYAGDTMLRHMIQALVEMYPDIPIVMHQDHGNSAGEGPAADGSGRGCGLRGQDQGGRAGRGGGYLAWRLQVHPPADR